MAKNDGSDYWAMEGSVHLIAKAEYTLCGAAMEGEDGDDDGMAVVPQKITCEQYVAIIEFVKAIPNKYHRRRKKPVRIT